jgi:hypothetical protein
MVRQLPTLSILHYVYGAFVCLTGLGLLFIVAVGGLLGSDLVMDDAGNGPPEWVGTFIESFGWAMFVFVEFWGVMNLLSGYWISKHINRTGTQVVAAFNCLNIPLGLVLAIFTFVAMSDKDVEDLYAYRA